MFSVQAQTQSFPKVSQVKRLKPHQASFSHILFSAPGYEHTSSTLHLSQPWLQRRVSRKRERVGGGVIGRCKPAGPWFAVAEDQSLSSPARENQSSWQFGAGSPSSRRMLLLGRSQV